MSLVLLLNLIGNKVCIRKSNKLQNYIASQDIRWQFNLARSPWWGGIYERLIKEIKKTIYKTLGRSHLSYDALESLIMDIERNLNNQPDLCLHYFFSFLPSIVLFNWMLFGSHGIRGLIHKALLRQDVS